MNISIDVESHAEPVLTSQLFSCDLLCAGSRRNELAFEQIQSAAKPTFLVVGSAIAKFSAAPDNVSVSAHWDLIAVLNDSIADLAIHLSSRKRRIARRRKAQLLLLSFGLEI